MLGSMGLFNLIMLFPVLMLLHFGNKSIQLPNRSQLIQITLNGVLGQMIAHPIWIWSVEAFIDNLSFIYFNTTLICFQQM